MAASLRENEYLGSGKGNSPFQRRGKGEARGKTETKKSETLRRLSDFEVGSLEVRRKHSLL